MSDHRIMSQVRCAGLGLLLGGLGNLVAVEPAGVHAMDVAQARAGLKAEQGNERARSAVALGWLRADSAAEALGQALADQLPQVRLQAVMALGWCGGRAQVPKLLQALDDPEWTVRQAASIALANLTAGELPFHALADEATRRPQVSEWRKWWAAQPGDRLPPLVVAALAAPPGKGAVETRRLQAIRAAGFLGGSDAEPLLIERLATMVKPASADDLGREQARSLVRALGRLGGPSACAALRSLLTDLWWARYAAYALGAAGDAAAVDPLLDLFPQVAISIGQPARSPEPLRTFGVSDGPRYTRPKLPSDDFGGFEASDRMLETPFAIMHALDRLSWTAPQRKRITELMPIIVNAMPSAFDGGLAYEADAAARLVANLLDRTGLRDATVKLILGANGLAGFQGHHGHADYAVALRPVLERVYWDCPQRAVLLGNLCTRQTDVPAILTLLDTSLEPWVKLFAAKALAIARNPAAAPALRKILAASPTEASFGWAPLVVGGLVADEYQAPSPRWREGVVRALGRCGDGQDASLLARVLGDDGNAPEVRNAAAFALVDLAARAPEALPELRTAEATHPLLTVRSIAREGLWRAGAALSPMPQTERPPVAIGGPAAPGLPPAVVFIKGPKEMPDAQQGFQIDAYRQNYLASDTGPEHRLGSNLFVLRPVSLDATAVPLTRFTDGYVASCEVSYDGRRVVFSRRSGDNPWWQVWMVDADGGNLHQITQGPYHHVMPTWLPDGRIAMSTTRLGTRDEYHGYLCTGLATMIPDGTDLKVVGMNVGRDNEPAVLDDGRIGFGRLEIFYGRLKTEAVLQGVFPDGRRNESLYGPERRDFWKEINAKPNPDRASWAQAGPMHRLLRFTQIQPWGEGRFLTMSSVGPVITGPGRTAETLVPHDPTLAVSSPWPLRDGTMLCSTGVMPASGPMVTDLDLSLLDASTGTVTILHRDPEHADFEARPLAPRPVPPVLATAPPARTFTATLACSSAFITRESQVAERGRYLRVVEGIPHTNRIGSHVNSLPWKNHTGSLGRVLATIPLPADGSFAVEVPADRLLHLQVLDADRQVVGNQLTWMDLRPGEVRSCIGCHEPTDIAPPTGMPSAQRLPPQRCLPGTDDLLYRAKAWFKNALTPEEEERTRTVRAFNLAAEN